MFLYAKIVLRHLLRQPSLGLLKRELKNENFPQGLNQAYVDFRYISRSMLNLTPPPSVLRLFPPSLRPCLNWNRYERVVIHILENPIENERDVARKILSWVARAERPLLWKEIQSLFCIEVEEQTADPDFKLVDPCKHFCGALVEVNGGRESSEAIPDSTVEFVHETARV